MTLDEYEAEVYMARRRHEKWLTITVDELEKLVRLARRAEVVKVMGDGDANVGQAPLGGEGGSR